MAQKNKMPITKALLCFFWLIVLFSFTCSGYLILIAHGQLQTIGRAALVLVSGLLLAAVVRMLANIGQLLFDIEFFLKNDFNQSLTNFNQLIDDSNKILALEFKETRKTMRESVGHLNEDVKTLNASAQQINCDSKDINQNIQQLRSFLKK